MPSVLTRAADGFPRRAFTVDEIIAMQDAGIISEDETFALIEEVIVPMGRKYPAQEFIKSEPGKALSRACRVDLRVEFETFEAANPALLPRWRRNRYEIGA